MFDILSAPFEMGATLATKPRKEQVEFVAPAVEALGSAGGAIVGTGAGPLGTVVGAGAGYAGAKELLRLAAGESGGETLPQAATRQAKNVLEGATMEAFGRGVVSPVLTKGAEYANKLKNIKLDQYIKAVGDKGEDIVNALRGRVQIVPGTSPTAGEVAAPAGSVGLSVLQSRARQVPGTAGLMGAGSVIGFLSGMVGAGGGFVSVPFMAWCNVAIHNAVATSAALGFPIALANVIGYVVAGQNVPNLPELSVGFLWLPGLIVIASCSVFMAPLGASAAHKLPVKQLKRVFASVLYLLAAYMLYKGFTA
jgi:hypothetical protein